MDYSSFQYILFLKVSEGIGKKSVPRSLFPLKLKYVCLFNGIDADLVTPSDIK